MKYIWAGDRHAKNARIDFSLELSHPCDTMRVCGADCYRIFGDGALLSAGPERCAAGYARVREINISGIKRIKVSMISYGVANYSVDMQDPFFAAELYSGGELIYSAKDFSASAPSWHVSNMPRYSGQRGFAEGFDTTRGADTPLDIYEVSAPTELAGRADPCKYHSLNFELYSESVFKGFDEVKPSSHYKNIKSPIPTDLFNIDEALKKAEDAGFFCLDYSLSEERCGFLEFEIEAEGDAVIYAVFEEICPDGKWIFRRAGNNDFIMIRTSAGKHVVLTAEPYALKLLKIIHGGGVKVIPRLITLENDSAECVTIEGDEDFVKVFRAAKNTFNQNAVDIFMDCPGRERAGWLCDSYFTALSERLFTGNNEIERAFLENIILAKTPELAEGMLPMCFPGEHPNGRYIPNWAMWFVIELEDYTRRTGDTSLARLAREKILKLIDFFEKYRNEYGLLENLDSWVFIEWSICNDDEYVKGVNYPSNMLYSFMLEKAAILLSDDSLKKKASDVRKSIEKLAFNGKFYVDNATRVDGELKNCEDHLSETCQYYALFMGLRCSDEFKEMIKCDFGPLRTDAYPEVYRSNMFIGNYLRFFWLISIGEGDRVIRECLKYFSKMANTTGTLWEHDRATASCNHGFASSAAVVLLGALCGYETTNNGKPIFKKNFRPARDYGVKVSFNYG